MYINFTFWLNWFAITRYTFNHTSLYMHTYITAAVISSKGKHSYQCVIRVKQVALTIIRLNTDTHLYMVQPQQTL